MYDVLDALVLMLERETIKEELVTYIPEYSVTLK